MRRHPSRGALTVRCALAIYLSGTEPDLQFRGSTGHRYVENALDASAMSITAHRTLSLRSSTAGSSATAASIVAH